MDVSVEDDEAGECTLTRTTRLVPSVMASFDTPYVLAVTMVAVLKTLLEKVMQKVRVA